MRVPLSPPMLLWAILHSRFLLIVISHRIWLYSIWVRLELWAIDSMSFDMTILLGSKHSLFWHILNFGLSVNVIQRSISLPHYFSQSTTILPIRLQPVWTCSKCWASCSCDPTGHFSILYSLILIDHDRPIRIQLHLIYQVCSKLWAINSSDRTAYLSTPLLSLNRSRFSCQDVTIAYLFGCLDFLAINSCDPRIHCSTLLT